ncbi:MAG: ParA family protein [Anaerolineales bacterium]|nr:ParA family protein [Anaerolineales bacterium]NOR84071.1 AAA family ATPase [Ardenticatenales bacterium]
MMRIYALANQKGGVGKTTTAINLGACLADRNLRVLLIDADPQANATASLGLDKTEITTTIYQALVEETPLSEAILRNPRFNLSLVPSNPDLVGAEVELVNLLGREFRLQRALRAAALSDRYDYILIDCPPSLGLLTVNALTAAQDGVIIPVQCEYLALEGLSQLTRTIDLVQSHLNPDLRIRGLLLTMYDRRTKLSQQVASQVRRHFGSLVFQTVVPRSIRLGEAPSFGEPILHYSPDSTGAVAYRELGAEVLRGDT